MVPKNDARWVPRNVHRSTEIGAYLSDTAHHVCERPTETAGFVEFCVGSDPLGVDAGRTRIGETNNIGWCVHDLVRNSTKPPSGCPSGILRSLRPRSGLSMEFA